MNHTTYSNGFLTLSMTGSQPKLFYITFASSFHHFRGYSIRAFLHIFASKFLTNCVSTSVSQTATLKTCRRNSKRASLAWAWSILHVGVAALRAVGYCPTQLIYNRGKGASAQLHITMNKFLLALCLMVGVVSCKKDEDTVDPEYKYGTAMEPNDQAYQMLIGKWYAQVSPNTAYLNFNDSIVTRTVVGNRRPGQAFGDTLENLEFYYFLHKEGTNSYLYLDCKTDPHRAQEHLRIGTRNYSIILEAVVFNHVNANQ